MRTTILCLSVLCAFLSGAAQDFKDDLTKLYSSVGTESSYRLKMNVEVKDLNNGEEDFKLQYIIEKHKEKCRYFFDNTSYLLNKQFLVYVNNNSERILYRKRKKSEKSPLKELTALDFDELLSSYSSIKFIGEHLGVKHYKLNTDSGPVSEIDLFLNESSQLKRLEYDVKVDELDQRIRVVCRFSDFDPNPQFESSDFSERQYITKEKGVFKGVNKYKDYMVQDVSVAKK